MARIIPKGGIPFSKETQKTPLSKTTKPILTGKGPYVDGFKPAEIDSKKKNKQSKFFGAEKFSENIEKIDSNNINNCMAQKSLFDQLFEDVMSDEEALGIEPGSSDEGSDFGGEGGDIDGEFGGEGEGEEVTLTLDRETAQKLLDMLSGALGEETESPEEQTVEDDLGSELGDEGEGEGNPFPESTEMKELKASNLTDKSQKKVSTSWSAGSKKVEGHIAGQDGKSQNLSDAGGKKLQAKGSKKVNCTISTLAGSKKNAFEG